MAYQRGFYHSAQPKWRNGFNKVGDYVGIELEVEATCGDHETILNNLHEPSALHRPITERDGSLDAYSGVEIVFPPFTIKTLKKKGSTFAKSLASIDKLVTPSFRTGLHVNVNTRGWGWMRIGTFMSILHNLPVTYLENIGGRRLNEYCQQAPRRAYNTYFQMDGHSRAAEFKGSRCELRFPASTTDHNKISRLLSFVNMLSQFSKLKAFPQPEDLRYEAHVEAFYKFLNTSKKRKAMLAFLQNGEPIEDVTINQATTATVGVSVGSTASARASSPNLSARQSVPEVLTPAQLGQLFTHSLDF